jgi:16S rRNA (cytosine967-C5)-methyltransferase
MTAREAALNILHRLEKEDVFVDRALTEILETSRLGRADRALITELVNGTLRWRRRLDWMLDQLLIRKKTADLTGWIRNILRTGLYQIQFLDRIPAAAATHQAVSLAKRYGHRGTASLVNAVLRNAIRRRGEDPSYPSPQKDPVAYIGVRYSHPDWMVRRWLERYGRQETIALCEANNRIPPLTVRVNSLQSTVEEVKRVFRKEGGQAVDTDLSSGFLRLSGMGQISGSEAFRRGWVQVQDESASFPARLQSPRPGQTIVDLCSAPGGKTAHLADLMEDRGLLLAVDVHRRRIHQVMENCRRLGITCVRPVVADGRMLAAGPVEGLLVDAPCSGLGVLARRADLRWRKREEDVPRLAGLQLELLDHAADLLLEGGVLVYSTCTIEDQENEEVISQLLSRRDDIALEKAASPLPAEVITPQGFVRTFPHRHGVDGTFAARLRKTAQGGSG